MPDPDHREEDGQRCRVRKGLGAFKGQHLFGAPGAECEVPSGGELKLIGTDARTRLRGHKFGGVQATPQPGLSLPASRGAPD